MCVIKVQEINSCMTSNKCPRFKNVQQYAKKERKKENSFMMTTTLTAIGISAYHLLPPVVSTVLMYFSKDE